MKRYIEHAPLVLLSLFTTKLLILNTWSFPEAAVLAALSAICCVFQLKAKNDEVKELRDILEKQAADIQKLQKQDENLQTSVTSMRIAVQSKAQGMKF